MTSTDIGKEVVVLCRQVKNQEAIDHFYTQHIETVEARAMP